MKLTCTQRAQKIVEACENFVPDYDRTVIVLHVNPTQVEASVHQVNDGNGEVGQELVAGNPSGSVTGALKELYHVVKNKAQATAAVFGLANDGECCGACPGAGDDPQA